MLFVVDIFKITETLCFNQRKVPADKVSKFELQTNFSITLKTGTMETQSNIVNLDGQNIYVGIDVHKKNWAICLRNDEFELKKFSQAPQPDLLVQHLKGNYPGAKYKCVYEAGFCGFLD